MNDLLLARATFAAVVKRWSGTKITLRNGKHSARDLTAHEISLGLRKDQELAYKLSRNPYQIY